MDFAWDPEKDARNVRERGIGFRVAIRVFDGPRLEDWDDREDYGEDRYRVIGMIDGRVFRRGWSGSGRGPDQEGISATHSISTSTSFGRRDTSTVDLAGGSVLKNVS